MDLLGRSRRASRAGCGDSRRDDRGAHAGIQRACRAEEPGPPFKHPSSAASSRVCLQKKRPRPAEQDRPDVATKRRAFKRWARDIDARRLVFIDESGANLALARSHAWVLKGEEYFEGRPMNWGKNLTMVGAIRHDGWLTMSTGWKAMNKDRFARWVEERLAPKLKRGDIVVMDNLGAHKDPRAKAAVEVRGATIKFLPPYSPDLNPIEPGWGLMKKRMKKLAPRTPVALRRTAHNARRAVRPWHCRAWFDHAGYRCGPK